MTQEESQCTHKGPCESCGSSDANAHYSDGHTHCFSCGKHGGASGNGGSRPKESSGGKALPDIQGEIQGLPKRGITEETCRAFGYRVGVEPVSGKRIHLAPYYGANGQIAAYKWRDASKKFGVFGKLKDALPLFGQHLWRDRGKRVVITEGEIDAMSVSQMQGNKWPVVSVPNGAQGAKKSLQAALEWLERFDEVVLMFDQDEPGRAAVEECTPLFSPGKCKIARLPLKDANELLQAGRGSEIITAIWEAKTYRPDGIISVADIADEACKDIPRGIPWFLPSLDDATLGRREGEIYALGAGTGIGKTDFFTQSVAHDLTELGLTVGVLFLEQPPVETVRRIAGKIVGRALHIPGSVTPDVRRSAIEGLRDLGRLHLYNSFGANEWDELSKKIRYMAVSLGCKVIYLDHLTALVASETDERKALDTIMEQLASLALELKAIIHFISHLTRPEGTPHEEGGRVMIRHFRGSNAIGMWSHLMLGMERNQQAEDEEEAQLTRLRILKDRNTGRATGKLIYLGYDSETCKLYEREAPSEDSGFPVGEEAF